MVDEKPSPKGINTQSTPTTSNNEDGNTPKTLGIVEEARSIREGLKTDLEEMRKLSQELKELRAFELLGGKSALTQEQKPKELSNVEYMRSVMKGQKI